MSRRIQGFQPVVESVERRIVLSTPATAATTVDTLAVLNEFKNAYPSRVGDANYNSGVDVNHNGIVGQDDGKRLLRELPAIAPNRPLTVKIALAPADVAKGKHPVNSGGVTHNRTPTIVGRTAPGALVFTGTGTTDLLLKGPAAVADAQGNFTIKGTLTDGINQFDVQAVDRYGHQVLRAFPILWLDFNQYEAAHPQKK